MISALYIIYLLLLGVELSLIAAHLLTFKKPELCPFDELPKVSILVCARNEEANLKDCLDSLLQINYPSEKVEILVGDDNSEDGTAAIVAAYDQAHDHIHPVFIEEEKDLLIAKGNVLSQLVDASSHDYQVIIDADMIVTKDWLWHMVSALVQGKDMVSGYTQVKASNSIANLQFIDWQSVLFVMKVMADLIRPISILGNNMAFKKSAYDKVGGFRGLGPTDVEDLGLLQQFQQQGLKTTQLLASGGQAYTKPQLTFDELLTQRCRWMNGVFTHHFILGIPALFARLWVVFALISVWMDYDLAIFIALYGVWINWIKVRLMAFRTKSTKSIFLYEPIIISLLDTFALLRIMIFGKVSWKGRKH